MMWSIFYDSLYIFIKKYITPDGDKDLSTQQLINFFSSLLHVNYISPTTDIFCSSFPCWRPPTSNELCNPCLNCSDGYFLQHQ
mmetsp:Transcript_3716/g.5086  ORF Transcript_3716/g.5086 Transcript_3716/m.5086 type:complete len:83 (-) Transcript_3716:29-277(-)